MRVPAAFPRARQMLEHSAMPCKVFELRSLWHARCAVMLLCLNTRGYDSPARVQGPGSRRLSGSTLFCRCCSYLNLTTFKT